MIPGNGKVSLSWKNPADDDLHQVELTANPADGALKNPVYLAAAKESEGSFIAEGLEKEKEYTVTIKTIDKSGNKSATGVSSTVTPRADGVMHIGLSQNPLKGAKTRGNVTVGVYYSSTSIKEAKWMEGAKGAPEVLKNGTAITDKKFEVTENGMYSVAVLDNDGRREVETIEIKNIDRTPPASVTGLKAMYSATDKKITVSWMNPADEDFAGLTLKWKKAGESDEVVAFGKTARSYPIGNIKADGSTYIFSVTAWDDASNDSSAAEATVEAMKPAEITGINLSRTHFDTEMTNRDIDVTVTGRNFTSLRIFQVQVTADDGSGEETPVDVNKATGEATVRAPIPSSSTDEGTTYTVKVLVDGETVPGKTATFKVTAPARVDRIQLSKEYLAFGQDTNVTVTVTGTNFDLRGDTKIKLFGPNPSKEEVTASTVTVPEDGNETQFTATIDTLPSEIGRYTVAVFFKGKKQNKTETFRLYGTPEITSITIPKAGISYGGKLLPVLIIGKEFWPSAVSEDDFSGSGAIFTDFHIESDTLATANVVCPSTAGETSVTVRCGPGTDQSKTGVLSVKDYGTGYDAGKIVLSDKNMVEKNDYVFNSSNPPVGVLCGSVYGVPKMIALHVSDGALIWAKADSTGYKTKLAGIICRQMGGGAAGTADAAANYPAFNWVNEYNTMYAGKLGSANIAWYMPSIAELCEVYKHKEVINESLTKIHDGNDGYADDGLGTHWYWSSSQASLYYSNAWGVSFSDGRVDYSSWHRYSRVCCIAGL